MQYNYVPASKVEMEEMAVTGGTYLNDFAQDDGVAWQNSAISRIPTIASS